MSSFRIDNADGPGSLEFFDRNPEDASQPMHSCWVRLTGPDLSATRRLDTIEACPVSPANLFTRMAERWRGWRGEMSWSLVEGDLNLKCTQDRAGHVNIRVELRRGWNERDWVVTNQLTAESGQLDEIARDARAFFGTSVEAGAGVN